MRFHTPWTAVRTHVVASIVANMSRSGRSSKRSIFLGSGRTLALRLVSKPEVWMKGLSPVAEIACPPASPLSNVEDWSLQSWGVATCLAHLHPCRLKYQGGLIRDSCARDFRSWELQYFSNLDFRGVRFKLQDLIRTAAYCGEHAANMSLPTSCAV